MYPGDAERPQEEMLEQRFWLVKVPEVQDLYEINDTDNDPVFTGFYIQIEKRYLLDYKFNFPLWYATQLAIHKGIDFESLPMTYWLDFQMGDVYAHGLAWRLTDGASQFPDPLVKRTPDECFWVYERELDIYVIADYTENMITKISKRHLENEKFNLLHWYKKKIAKSRKSRGLLEKSDSSNEDKLDHRPIWDLHGISASKLLELGAPYPGDEERIQEGGVTSSPRFELQKTGHKNHLIFDTLCQTEIMIASGHLKSKGFPLAKWYAEQCNHMDGRRQQHRWPERFHTLQTNETMCKLISTLLQIGSPYPGDPDHDYLGQ
ncbi:hypothetical protein L208DRAFT_1538828 [Tricholoma matsutake]|nr:hypothetical protein L208DRAFT_1538828 [Tricholoma matsutake 945]